MSNDLATKECPINPAMITLGREARGLNQTELSKAVGISQPALSNIEAGLSNPSEEVVENLSKALGYPPKFFSQSDPIFGPGLSEFFHRKRQDVPVKTLKRIHAQINIVRIHLARLLRSVDLPECKISPMDLEDFGGQPREIARAVRAAWHIEQGPIPNVIKLIEDSGGIVVRMDFGTPRVDAISRLVPGLPPIFFVNSGLSADRERLTLCHELGHSIMHHRKPSAEMEEEANRFAAEFLMPERDIAPHLDRKITLQRLAALKSYWRVSMAAILYRASELRKISERSARALWSRMSMLGYKRREPPELDLSPEQPTLLHEIIGLHRSHFGYGIEQFRTVLTANDGDLMNFYGIGTEPTEARTRLRIVK